MSGVVEAPVTKYGRSSEFGVVLDFIQTMISNDTLRQAFNIPHLVMVGRQNMAKTTLINRLIGRYLLPMRRNETANTLQARTTYPIILNLRNGEKRAVEVKCDKVPGIGGAVDDPTDDVVENFLNQVTGHLPKEEGTPISKTPVNVTLTGPELTTLTLVDLPGAHFANDDPRMNHVTQSLVLEYIEKNTNSIIVIVSEVGDPTGDSAINLVMQKAADFRSRTICALTKPDKLRDFDDMGKRVAMNESSFTLEDNRFILLRGKDGTDPNEKDWDAEMTRIKEKEWFGRHKQYKDIQHVCGIDRLMDTMISLLAEKMITEIPILVRQMKQRKTEVDEELKGLEDSEVPESSEGKGGVAMKLKNNLIKELNKLLFNNTFDMEEGGEKVRHLFNSYHEAVFKVRGQ
ncbi:Dynamin- GTPase protein [Desmophyllum pertusum]|uniref:Dynamin- GTPase protein n=1 Tax=Desmophyllum pertusum TaxID=174260 RepID=A0A9X0DAC9_9CNID|nr:Dynamin- GTPase protein [Desmophyllum pertusum]